MVQNVPRAAGGRLAMIPRIGSQVFNQAMAVIAGNHYDLNGLQDGHSYSENIELKNALRGTPEEIKERFKILCSTYSEPTRQYVLLH